LLLAGGAEILSKMPESLPHSTTTPSKANNNNNDKRTRKQNSKEEKGEGENEDGNITICKTIVLCDKDWLLEKELPKKLKTTWKQNGIKPINLTWVLDSISNYELLNQEEYFIDLHG
jgi:hypothetical protein